MCDMSNCEKNREELQPYTMTGGSIGSVVTNTTTMVAAGGPDMLHKYVTLAQKDELIKEQYEQICRLKRELEGLASERDLLLCEVSNLRFELEMVELKRLQDESFQMQKIERTTGVVPIGGTMYSPGQTYIAATYLHHAVGPSSTSSSYIQGQNYQMAPSYAPGPTMSQSYITAPDATPMQSGASPPVGLHKKGSIRNGDVLKRTRVQTAYELSQDLLDKQIEMLERKYGGIKARKAALTIQRAFRRYTLLKKFAAITAMAKAEKRLSRRLQNVTVDDHIHSSSINLTDVELIRGANTDSECMRNYNSFGGRECGNNGGGNSTSGTLRPVRSMSLRERRNMDIAPLPRSQSGTANTCWGGHNVSHYVQRQDSVCELGLDGNSIQEQSSQQMAMVSPCKVCSPGGAQTNLVWSRSDGGSNGQSPCTIAQSSCNTSINNSSYYRTPRIIHSNSQHNNKKVPPEVPKRTSSISSKSMEPRPYRGNGLTKTTENGSLSSVQSSGSDSSLSADRALCEGLDRGSSSPVWKRKGLCRPHSPEANSESSLIGLSHNSASVYTLEHAEPTPVSYKVSETVRKRQYRVGLNLFNKKPERGVSYLIRKGFLENSPQGVARFLISRKGLSKQMIGEYLGNLQNSFNMNVLECFAHELDLSGMQVDVALRKFQAYFRMPGEAQKIERLMEVFSQRYCQCNIDIVARLRSPDTIFVLAFAIIMLNTDLHTPNLKPERRMRLDDFIKNLRGIDDCGDIDRDMLVGIYERVKANEFKPSSDHVTQVMKVQATIVGKKPNMALPHRRLVCYCRLYEIPDISKKERPGVHQREVFLFNDLLVITKILSKKKSSVTYTFRQSFSLCGMVVALFEVPHYPYGIRLSQRVDGKVLITFNARNEHDRRKFAEDLRESISEMDEMESLRIEAELERQKSGRGGGASSSENRDSGVADVEVCACPCGAQTAVLSRALTSSEDRSANTSGDSNTSRDTQLKRSALSNSLLDIHDQFSGEKPQRRGSVGSLDSGMSISFQSTSVSSGSRPEVTGNKSKPMNHQQSFLGGLFNKRERKLSRSEDPAVTSTQFIRSTEV